MAVDTIPARLLAQATRRPDAPAYYWKERGAWRSASWKTFADEVRTVGKALLALGVEPGQCVVILGFNRPEWSIMDLACMSIGGAPAGIYTTCSPPEVAYITSHTEAPVALAENIEQWEKFQAERANLPKLKHVVLMKGAGPVDDDMVITWDELLAKAEDSSDEAFQQAVDALKLDQLATLIYTSGTTGPPKGVMLSHENLAWTSKIAVDIIGGGAQDRGLSYLPLSHIAEQMFTLHVPCTTGAVVYYAESIEQVKANLLEAQPTVFFGVPRIWEKFYAAFKAAGAETQGIKKKIATWAKGVGTRVNDLRNRSQEPTGLLALQYRLAHKLVFSKVKEKVGLQHLRVAVTGAAPISRDILEFFASLDIVVLEVYGQSEDTGPTSFNLPGRTRFGSVGPALAGVEVKIDEDEEVLVKGKNVFLGYYKDEEATKATLIDGWLHSGDLGKIDSEGFLHITGRKKDIIITAGGKNITPKNLESSIKQLDLVGEAVVVGDRRKYLIALVSLDPDNIDAYAKSKGITREQVFTHQPLIDSIQGGVDEMNKSLARVEQIKTFKILPRPLSIEDGELTPTMKVKRAKVNSIWSDLIDEVYGEKLQS